MTSQTTKSSSIGFTRLAFANLLRALEYSPGGLTINQLSEVSGLTRNSVTSWIKILHQPQIKPNVRKNVVYIHGWTKRCNFWTAQYKLGSSPDAAKPLPKSNAVKMREYRAKLAKERDAKKGLDLSPEEKRKLHDLNRAKRRKQS